MDAETAAAVIAAAYPGVLPATAAAAIAAADPGAVSGAAPRVAVPAGMYPTGNGGLIYLYPGAPAKSTRTPARAPPSTPPASSSSASDTHTGTPPGAARRPRGKNGMQRPDVKKPTHYARCRRVTRYGGSISRMTVNPVILSV